MMTTTVTVSLVIPLLISSGPRSLQPTYPRAAAAPRKAYVPGVIQGASGAQAANIGAVGYAVYSALTRMPIILPKYAPTAMDGTKIPHGTLQPYVTMIINVRMIVARRRELTMRHCAEDLLISKVTPPRNRWKHTGTVLGDLLRPRTPGTAMPCSQSCRSAGTGLSTRRPR